MMGVVFLTSYRGITDPKTHELLGNVKTGGCVTVLTTARFTANNTNMREFEYFNTCLCITELGIGYTVLLASELEQCL